MADRLVLIIGAGSTGLVLALWLTRPDPDAPKPTAPAPRKDFFNPLQSQTQLGGRW